MTSIASGPKNDALPDDIGVALAIAAGLGLLLAAILFAPGLIHWLPLLILVVIAHNRGEWLGLVAAVVLLLLYVWLGDLPHAAMAFGAFAAILIGRRWSLAAAASTTAAGMIATLTTAAVCQVTRGSWLPAFPMVQALPGAILVAAIADLLNANVKFAARWPFVGIGTGRSIFSNVRTGLNLVIILLACPVVSQLLIASGVPGGASLFGESTIDVRHGESLLLLAGIFLALGYRVVLERVEQAQSARIAGPPEPCAPAAIASQAAAAPEPAVQAAAEGSPATVAPGHKTGTIVDLTARLYQTLGLVLMREIEFDPEHGMLTYCAIDEHDKPVRTTIEVLAEDRAQFSAAARSKEAMIEIRPGGETGSNSLLLSLLDHRGGMRWGSGGLVRTGRPRQLDDLMTRQARLADLGHVASAIGHEIRQPLSTIAVAAENLRLQAARGQGALTDPQILARVERIAEQVIRARNIIEHVSGYGRQNQPEATVTEVGEIMRQAHSFLEFLLDDERIDVTMTIEAGGHWATISPIELEQVFVNAIQNAIDSLKARRRAGWSGTPAIDIRLRSAGAAIICTIEDNGEGLGEGTAQEAFRAFFSTKADEGLGLGLYISRHIIERAGGTIELRPASGGGAVLEVQLPVSGPPAPAPAG